MLDERAGVAPYALAAGVKTLAPVATTLRAVKTTPNLGMRVFNEPYLHVLVLS